MSRVSSPTTGSGSRRAGATRTCCLRSIEQRAAATSTAGAPRPRSIALLPQVDLAARDAADVEQVVHQPGQVADLALDDAGRALLGGARRSARRAGSRPRCGSGPAGCAARGPSMARNSLIRRSAASSSSMRFRSVRSRVTLAKPRSLPSASSTAVMTTLAQNRVPSLRTRQPSSSNRPSRGGDAQLVLRPAVSIASWG